ncbi:MAG: SRPBCC family protein [Alphaproteobacteria bacterium]|jgi:uncharacterized protein YndB with AHSA1/START domain|nr:SRPBCC family protein [Alphaproteobacteria bacterium]
MTARSIVHASFTITRIWDAAPARVFEAFARQDAKDKWFAGPGNWTLVSRSFDFREGGIETMAGRWESGRVTRFDCVYRDIVPPENGEGRIIYTYNMFVDERKISVSQAAIELKAEGKGTKFALTEYGDYLDGYDDAGSREHGTNLLMDALGKSLEG